MPLIWAKPCHFWKVTEKMLQPEYSCSRNKVICVCFGLTALLAEAKGSQCSKVPPSQGTDFCVTHRRKLKAQPSPWNHAWGNNPYCSWGVFLPILEATRAFSFGNPALFAPWLYSAMVKQAIAETLCFVTFMNIAVGWESSPGKKAPAMSFFGLLQRK